MAPLTKGKSGNAKNADFKRIKAKVGKKAPKPANVTDTAFRAASLQTSSQTSFTNGGAPAANLSDDVSLYSARGRSLQSLASQLSHPAAAVRASAAKGLYDLVSGAAATATGATSSSLLQAHLSALIPAVGKCVVDEDSEVRTVGTNILRETVNKLNEKATMALRPFIKLLIAFVASALNSLDRDSRRDGAILVELLSSSVPTLVAPYAVELLPALIRSLDDRDTRLPKQPGINGSSDTGTKKRKRRLPSVVSNKSTANLNGRHLLLQSLVTLLQSAATLTGSSKSETQQQSATGEYLSEPDLIFGTGGRSRNAVILRGRPTRRLAQLSPIQKLTDLPSLEAFRLSLARNDGPIKVGLNTSLPPKTVQQLYHKLRDCFVETTQRGYFDAKQGYVMTVTDLSTFLLVAKALRLTWDVFGNEWSQLQAESDVADMRKSFAQAVSLILEIFPISRADEATQVVADDVNGELCVTLVLMGPTSANQGKEKTGWADKVVAHVLTSMDEMHVQCHQASSMSPTSARSVFAVLNGLVLTGLCNVKSQNRLISMFSSTFFAPESKDSARMCTSICRQATDVANRIFERMNYDIDKASEPMQKLAVDVLKTIPAYLVAWGAIYIPESSSAIALLHHLVRRLGDEDKSMLDLGKLRNDLDQLMMVSESMQKQKFTTWSTVLECYPPTLQRLFVSLIIMLGKPSDITLKLLGRISARCQAKGDPDKLAIYVAQSMFSIRKTVSMSSFLTFLIDGTGVFLFEESAFHSKPKTEGDNRYIRLFELDNGVRLAATNLVACGSSAKTLPMLEALLSTLIRSCDVTKTSTQRELFRIRAGFSILALFALDLRRQGSSIFDILPRAFKVQAMAGIGRLLAHAPSLDSESNENIDRALQAWIRPVVTLLASEDGLLVDSFTVLVSSLHNWPDTHRTSAVQTLLLVIRAPTLAPVFRRSDIAAMVAQAKVLEQASAESPLASIAGQVVAELELHISG
jgi:hypothetical protein